MRDSCSSSCLSSVSFKRASLAALVILLPRNRLQDLISACNCAGSLFRHNLSWAWTRLDVGSKSSWVRSAFLLRVVEAICSQIDSSNIVHKTERLSWLVMLGLLKRVIYVQILMNLAQMIVQGMALGCKGCSKTEVGVHAQIRLWTG